MRGKAQWQSLQRPASATPIREGEWIIAVHARWAAHRGHRLVADGDGAVRLVGDAVRAMVCDVKVIPVVTGTSTRGVLEDLVGPYVKPTGRSNYGTLGQSQAGRGPGRSAGQGGQAR